MSEIRCYCSHLGPRALENCSFSVKGGGRLTRVEPRDLLLRIPVVQKLPEASRERVLATARVRVFRAGETLFPEGAPRDTLMVVRAGSVRVLKQRGELWHQQLTEVRAGYPVNLLATLTGEVDPADLVARRAGSLVEVDVEPLLAGLQETPELLEGLLRCGSMQYRALLDLAVDLSLYTLDERLVRFLLQHAPPAAPDPESGRGWGLSHGDLAVALGATREEVTRRIGRLKKKGLIEVGFRALAIRDRPALEKLAPRPEGAFGV